MDCSATQAATVTVFDGSEDKTQMYESDPNHLRTVEDAVGASVENNIIRSAPTIECSLSHRMTAKNKIARMWNPTVVRYTLLGSGHNSVKINNANAELKLTI